jgi:hypothetical protein
MARTTPPFAVELRQDESGEPDGVMKPLCLRNAILPGGCVDHKQSLVRFASELLRHRTFDLLQLLHQVVLRLEAPRRVDEQDAARARRVVEGVEDDGRRIGARLLPHEVCPDAIGPDGQLLDGGRAERVRGGKRDRQAGVLFEEAGGDLGDRRRLAGAVHPGDEDDRRRRVGSQSEGALAARESGKQDLTQRREGIRLLSPTRLHQLRHEARRESPADVAGNEHLLELLDLGRVETRPPAEDVRHGLGEGGTRSLQPGSQTIEPGHHISSGAVMPRTRSDRARTMRTPARSARRAATTSSASPRTRNLS